MLLVKYSFHNMIKNIQVKKIWNIRVFKDFFMNVVQILFNQPNHQPNYFFMNVIWFISYGLSFFLLQVDLMELKQFRPCYLGWMETFSVWSEWKLLAFVSAASPIGTFIRINNGLMDRCIDFLLSSLSIRIAIFLVYFFNTTK